MIQNISNTDLSEEDLSGVRKIYTADAETYDFGYSEVISKETDTVVVRNSMNLINRSKERNGGRAIIFSDGCGTFYPEIHQNLINWEGVNYIGGDLTYAMMEAGIKEGNFAQINAAQKFAVQIDGHHLPFADNSLDLALGFYGPWSYSQNPVHYLAEKVRVLKDGAELMLMPYSARLGSANMTSFSTAYDNAVDKRFYTRAGLMEIARQVPELKDIKVEGYNYIGHVINGVVNFLELSQVEFNDVQAEFYQRALRLNHKPSTDELDRIIEILQNFTIDLIPNLSITSLDYDNELRTYEGANLINQINIYFEFKNQLGTPGQSEYEMYELITKYKDVNRAYLPSPRDKGFSVNENYLEFERHHLESIGWEPGMARHMSFSAKVNKNNF